MKHERYSNQLKILREKSASKSQGQHAGQFNSFRYESPCVATKIEIHRECFPWNFAKF